MCNACGFMCCAYDGFSGCGCDHCDCPACWSEEDEDCGGDDEFLCEGFDAGEWTETPKIVNVGDDLHQVLADALNKK